MLRRGMWAWPFVLALVFASTVAGWLQWSDTLEREDERRTLISDSLTLENRISDVLAGEESRARLLANMLPGHINDAQLQQQAAVVQGLQRMWVSVTVLDPNNRLLAHVPENLPRPLRPEPGSGLEEGSLSVHFALPTRGGGQLVVRYSPATLLHQTVPWWLSRKYDVRLVDDYGQRIASTGDTVHPEGHQSYRITLSPPLQNVFLDLTTREVRKPWWRTLPLALMVVFLLLSAAASWTLRSRMREVARAEDRWRTEAAWRRAIEDSLTVGLRGRDVEGRLVHVNRAFCAMVGFTPDQLLGQLPPMPYWLPDGMEVSMQRHRRNMAGNAPPGGYEARWQRADGTPIDVMIFEAPLVDAHGVHKGWMASIVNITERKRSEERERRQLEALSNQARLTTLGEVASALAHQLNQPLAALASYNAGVLRTLERQNFSDNNVLEALRREGEQVAEAGRIVQRIRGFLTRRAPQPEPCEVQVIVANVLKLLRRDLQSMSLEVPTRIAQALPNVLADPVLVEQVLINLLRNAMDALAGVPLARLEVSAQLAGTRFVRIDVDDNGCGLGGLDINALAAPFHSTKADGMGMGLAICRSVIESHHGALEASISPLGGARFSFTLPVESSEVTL